MEKQLDKKEKTIKNKEKPEIKNEIIVKKKINLLNRVSLAKSPSFQQSSVIKSKKFEKNNDKKNKDTITKRKIKLPSDLVTRKKNYDMMLNKKNIDNCQSEIKEKNIIFKKNNEDKKKILGQIITDFSSNKKLNNNIFDDGNQLTLNSKEYNNIFNNDINNNLNKTLEFNKKNNELKKTNNIQEIKLQNFNINNNNQKSMKLSISSSRGNYYKRRPFYIVGINNKDKNNKINNDIDTESIKNKNKVETKTSLSNNITTSVNNLNTENILENVRKRNKPKKRDNQISSLTYNDNNLINKINEKKIEEKKIEEKNEINENKINNINNINNNISLNNRYNFYIKIGKNNKLDINKDNKDINYEIKLTSPNQDKENISSRVIKKLIVECDIGKINKKINNDKKEINVNIKPLYKKIEIDKIVLSNDNKYKVETIKNNNKNKIYNSSTQRAKSKTNRVDNKSFKFLIHQAYNNRDLSTSFNRYYKSGQTLRHKSQSTRDNKYYNNDSFYNSNEVRETARYNEYNKPLGLKYFNSEKKNYDENNEKYKKYKSFYKSFRNIGRIKKTNNISCEETFNKDEIKNTNEINNEINIKNKLNNLTYIINNNENKVNNLEFTPVSISISNTNEENINNNNNNLMNSDINNNANRNKNNNENNIHRMVYSLESLESQLNTPESRLIHSKINTSYSTNNSYFNSISSTCNKNNEVNTNIRNIFPISTNLSISFINLEVLYVLEEKLKIILEKIKNYQRCIKECYDFINYYFVHNFYNEELRLFKFGPNRKIINNYMKIELLCHFLCYDISFIEDFKQIEILLKSIFSLLHINFLLFLSLVIIQYKNKDNNIIILLNKIVKDNLSLNDLNEEIINIDNIDENKYTEIIENNSKKIIDYYKMIIDNIYVKNIEENNKYIQFPDCLNFINPNSLNKEKIQIVISNFFIQAYKSLSEYNFDILKKFFYSFLYFKQTSKLYNDIMIEQNSKIIKNKNDVSETHYLLPKIKNNKYTLVLDLDETLVYCHTNSNYKIKSSNNILNDKINIPKASINLRPGLHEFLHNMKLLFELVIFSSGTPDYVDPIIKIIEKDEKYFDYILYRQHITTDENGDTIKNLNLIGRDLKNVIIVDDIPKYFKLQKENGICIRPFYGNILSDRKTLSTLKNVLTKIRFDADETKDIRISLEKYRHLLYPIVTNSN